MHHQAVAGSSVSPADPRRNHAQSEVVVAVGEDVPTAAVEAAVQAEVAVQEVVEEGGDQSPHRLITN